MLPLLSGGLRDILNNILEKHEDCTIAQELLTADALIESYLHVLRNAYGFELNISLTNDMIENAVSKYITNHCRMISFRFNESLLSYLPEGKEVIYTNNNTWGRENREVAKPARLIQKVLVNEHKCKEYEDFSNWIKAEMLSNGDFEIVEGSDITKYYNEDNYYQVNGSLGSSCMRYSRCAPYFEIYEDNAKMLVKMKNDKILGRAIIWEIDGKTYMDRIYVCQDYLENQFIDYAETHKWYYRTNNRLLNDGEDQYWKGPEDNYESSKRIPLTIILEKDYPYMPYVDSFRYYNDSQNSINDFLLDDVTYHCLSDTYGGYGDKWNEDDYNTATCEYCGREVHYYVDDDPEGLCWSEHDECYYCDHHCWYSSYSSDYYSILTKSIIVETNYGQSSAPLFMYEDSPDECITLINGKYYDIDCNFIQYNEETEKYELK